MQRVDAPEILDSDACSPAEIAAVLKVIGSINRRFGGIATTQRMVERAARVTGGKRFSLLEVASGLGDVPEIVRKNVARAGITLDLTLLDIAASHLPLGNHAVVANALHLPFADSAFDLVSCNLFAHHLNPEQLRQFMREGLRVCRQAVLINDLVRHPLHLALVYASYPLMRNRVAWLDGLTSVRRAYVPEEMRGMLGEGFSPQVSAAQVEIFRHYLFRMGVMVWKMPLEGRTA